MFNPQIQTLEIELNYYNEQRKRVGGDLEKYQNAYDSLCEFKNVVSSSQEEFSSIVSYKYNFLSNVSDVTNDCITAQRYYEGMSGLLKGIGANLVGNVYSVLISSINSKLHEYSGKIDKCNSDLDNYEAKMDDVRKQIKKAKEDEEKYPF